MYHFSDSDLPPDNFREYYRSFSVAMLPGHEREDVESGGKIIMPPSALDSLTRKNTEYPMLFKLTNLDTSRVSHAGVLEFIAAEGKCYLPTWMMANMHLNDNDFVVIESASLPIATFCKFQPQSVDFLDITNPKAVLENALRCYACLTIGDTISIKYNKKIYNLNVLETKPSNAVSIIECDMNVDFEQPIGYQEPKPHNSEEKDANALKGEEIDPFGSVGIRLDGKKQKAGQKTDQNPAKELTPRGIPDYDYKVGTLTFARTVKPISDRVNEPGTSKQSAPKEEDDAKWGTGFSLKR